jgi:hypothetical protein
MHVIYWAIYNEMDEETGAPRRKPYRAFYFISLFQGFQAFHQKILNIVSGIILA